MGDLLITFPAYAESELPTPVPGIIMVSVLRLTGRTSLVPLR